MERAGVNIGQPWLGRNNAYIGSLEAGLQSSNKEPMYGLVRPPRTTLIEAKARWCCVKLKVVQSILPSQVSVIQQNAITSNVHSHNCMNIGPGILSPEIYESSLLVDLGIFNDKKSPHDAE